MQHRITKNLSIDFVKSLDLKRVIRIYDSEMLESKKKIQIWMKMQPI